MIRCCSSILNRLILSRFDLSWSSKTTAYSSSNASSSANTTANTTTNCWLSTLLDHRLGGYVRPKVKTLHINLLRAQIDPILIITVIFDFSKILETTSYLGACPLSALGTNALFVTHAPTYSKPTLLTCNILPTLLLTYQTWLLGCLGYASRISQSWLHWSARLLRNRLASFLIDFYFTSIFISSCQTEFVCCRDVFRTCSNICIFF